MKSFCSSSAEILDRRVENKPIAFPDGVDECVTKAKDASKKKYGDDLNKSSACTDEELDKCLQDLKAATCLADESPPPVPCDC